MNPIVAIVLIWVATIILSYWMAIYTGLHLFNEFAKNGWLLNSKKIPNANNKFTKYIFLIPIVNIFFGLYMGASYNKILQAMSTVCDVYADPMTDSEKQRYDKKPSYYTIATIISDRDKLADVIKKETERLNELQQKIDDIIDVANTYRVNNYEVELARRDTQRVLDKKKALLEDLKNGKISIDEYYDANVA